MQTRSRIFRLVFGLLCGILAPALPAATVNDLHTAEVPAADNSEAELIRAIEAAFQVVLVKLTGNSQSANLPAVAKLRARARQYNTLFGYERGADGALRLRADFDLPAVSAALRERGLPVWGKERPEVATWLVLTDGDGRRVMPDDRSREIFDSLVRQAALRAIPVRHPAATATLNALLAEAGDDDALLTGFGTLATQFGTPASLVILLDQQADGLSWQLRWRLAVEAETAAGEASGELPVPLLIAGVDRALDALAHHYLQSTVSTAASTVELSVEDITTADAYGRALNYLARLDVVGRVDVNKIEGTTVFFKLIAHGGLPALAQSIGFGQVLSAVPEAPTRYRLSTP